MSRDSVSPSRRASPGLATGGLLPGNRLADGRAHEFYATEPDDAAAAAGLVAGLVIAATQNGPGNSRPVIWLRSVRSHAWCGTIQGAGWVELGGAAEACLAVLADDAKALLRAGLDAVRSLARGVVVIEARGRIPELDLTASRRLALAAERSGVLLVLLRGDAEPVPSAAETRWSVAAAPSRALAGHAPGMPAFDIELLRHRSGPAGGRWRLEWDRDRRLFRDAALSGAVVPVPPGRAADGRGEPARYAA